MSLHEFGRLLHVLRHVAPAVFPNYGGEGEQRSIIICRIRTDQLALELRPQKIDCELGDLRLRHALAVIAVKDRMCAHRDPSAVAVPEAPADLVKAVRLERQQCLAGRPADEILNRMQDDNIGLHPARLYLLLDLRVENITKGHAERHLDVRKFLLESAGRGLIVCPQVGSRYDDAFLRPRQSIKLVERLRACRCAAPCGCQRCTQQPASESAARSAIHVDLRPYPTGMAARLPIVVDCLTRPGSSCIPHDSALDLARGERSSAVLRESMPLALRVQGVPLAP